MRRAAAWTAIGASACTLVLLAALHVLSPEFDPSWRVVSEYANGHYGWVLSSMFATWAVSSWALAYALWPSLRSAPERAGLWFLVASGAGEALAAVFDINQPLHGLAGLLGAGGLPAAAMLISAGKRLQWLANLTWIMVVALIGSLVLLFVTFTHAGGHVPADGGMLPIGTKLPPGAIALVGYVNRLMVLVNCLWVMLAAGEWVLRRAGASRDRYESGPSATFLTSTGYTGLHRGRTCETLFPVLKRDLSSGR
ncbi:MAG TPA: DUF998 domain-containing protein [Candidatus Cybelea sp.]|nr:DUF998 domain-containing protein [Candidatus Cybelea sp.]